MRSRSYRRWRVAFWVGLAPTVALAALWVVSTRQSLWFAPDNRKCAFCIVRGIVAFIRVDHGASGWESPAHIRVRWWPAVDSPPGIEVTQVPLWMLALPPAALTTFACRR